MRVWMSIRIDGHSHVFSPQSSGFVSALNAAPFAPGAEVAGHGGAEVLVGHELVAFAEDLGDVDASFTRLLKLLGRDA